MFNWTLVLQFWGIILGFGLAFLWMWLLIGSLLNIYKGKTKIIINIIHVIVFAFMATSITLLLGFST